MQLHSLKSRVDAMPLFFKAYALIALLLVMVIGPVEIVLEPVLKSVLERSYGGFEPWHEGILWLVSILIPSFACGFVLTKILSVKLSKITMASKEMRRGNLDIRLPVTNNENDAFDVLADNFNKMAQAVKAQQEYGRRLMADISHELRSPLARMFVATDLIGRKCHDDDVAPDLARMEKELNRMNEMVAILLRHTKEKLLSSAPREHLDLAELLSGLADDFSFQGKKDGKLVKARLEAGLTTFGDASQLRKMVGNILSNALFYSPAGGIIQLDARSEGKRVRVSIRDFGKGVPDAQLGNIFRAFYRVDGSRARTSGGVGLGLAVAREIALQHGGNIVAKNADPGLLVVISLPLCDTEAENGTKLKKGS